MRTFIAIEIPTEIKIALAAWQDELRRAEAEVRWTQPENIHLTLKFLGEIAESSIKEIAAVCADSAAQCQPLRLSLSAPGAFPNVRQPRVLWAGLNGDVESALQLQARLEERLAALGLAREEKAFRLHLTIGRVKSNQNARQLIVLADAYALPALSFTVHEIVLMKSELHRDGARYTPLARAPLAT